MQHLLCSKICHLPGWRNSHSHCLFPSQLPSPSYHDRKNKNTSAQPLPSRSSASCLRKVGEQPQQCCPRAQPHKLSLPEKDSLCKKPKLKPIFQVLSLLLNKVTFKLKYLSRRF